ncbi:MAG: FAD-dependent thymidylate synthase [Chloroflexi bacterium]|nr:FAD-dependent thymidylate synthase [Chloroflexota bacterium]
MIEQYDIEVRLLAITGLTPSETTLDRQPDLPPSELLIEYAGRLCWGTTDKVGTTPGRIEGWLAQGHESVIEHAAATFYVRASRVLTHELVRHRLASYSQRSQRYVRESSPRYVTPPELAAGQRGGDVFEKTMLEAWAAYSRLLQLGVKPEIARYVLPSACETEIVMTMNFRELRHFIKLRTSKRSLPEMRAVAGEMKRIMQQQAPRVFGDL